ncbi:oligosaccharide flippase family protein [Traorella massiliensis]|uniref:oligosaccharide flippase family protein n=1 Tax=Traorella massiliensis TaxID=1903263 RepID=UPI0023560477|nr:oligosaccharide flippase family protein [Traorella massiliensis]
MIKTLLNKYKLLSVTVKATFWFTVCNFLLKGISFITVPIFAAILPTAEYGAMSIYYSYEQIFLIFATLELSIGAYQRGVIKYKDNEKLFTTSVIVLGNIITFINLIVFCIFQDWIVSFTNISMTILVLMLMYFFVQPAYNAWLTRKRFSYEYKPAVLATLLFSILTTAISLFAVYLIEQTSTIKIISALIVEIIFCLFFYIKNLNIVLFFKNLNLVKEYWIYCLKFQMPLLFHSLSYLLLSQSDRVMIGNLVNNTKAAIYSVAYNLASAVLIFQQSLNQVFKPWRYQKMESKEYATIYSTSTTVTLLLGVMICLFILLAPDVIRLLFRKEYYESIWTIPPVSISVFFMYLYSMFSDIESYFYDTKYMAFISVSCAILNIVLNYFGIILFGYIACAYTTLITYVIFSLGHYYFMKKSLKRNGVKAKIYDVKKLSIISIIILIYGLIVLVLYKYDFLRYLALVLILSLIVYKRKYFINVIKTMKN